MNISPHALLYLWCNIPAKFHSNPCKDVGGVEKTNFDATEGRNDGHLENTKCPLAILWGGGGGGKAFKLLPIKPFFKVLQATFDGDSNSNCWQTNPLMKYTNYLHVGSCIRMFMYGMGGLCFVIVYLQLLLALSLK